MPENWWEFPQRIEAAETMEDLAALHDELTQAWNNGEVDHEVVESLTDLLWKRDKMLQASEPGSTFKDQDRSGPDKDAVSSFTLDEFARSGLVRMVDSKVLGERVIWAADNATEVAVVVEEMVDSTTTSLPSQKKYVVYRAAELKELRGASPERLRAIHELKRTGDWELLPSRPSVEPAGPPVPEGVCPACRQSQWWDKAGHKICAVCHPQPKRFTN